MSFSLTRKSDYALVALAALAEQHGDSPQPMSARQIAERYELPLPLLMNVLKDLQRGGVVTSKRGASGGYLLANDPGSTTMLQIIEALEGPVRVALCCDDEQNGKADEGAAHRADDAEECIACRVLARCPVNPPMQQFNDMVREFLGSIRLGDLLNEQTSLTLNSLALTLTKSGASR